MTREVAHHRPEQPCSADDLRTLFLFEKLTDDQLAQLCTNARIEVFETGPVVEEGEDALLFLVLMDGEIVISKLSGDRDIEAGRTSHRGTYCGAVASCLEEPPRTYPFSVRATTRSRFVVLDAHAFGGFVREHFAMAVHMLQGLWGDHEGIHRTVDHHNRIRAAGTIAAGLAHGLNNPASATVRAAADLRSRVNRLALNQVPSDTARTVLAAVIEEIQCRHAQQSRMPAGERRSPLENSRLEDEICDWLDDHDVSNPWSIAPTLTAAGMDATRLDAVVNTLDCMRAPDSAELALSWLANVIDAQHLINDIAEAGERISELVDASRQFSHMDGSAFDVVDLHLLLDSTIDVLAPRLGTDIAVVREYDVLLPGLPCYPSELAQAFSHILSNGIDAMRGGDTDGRTLTLRTGMTDNAVFVEITDTGPGIDSSICEYIFDPFFTTKPVGEGAGLGLNIAWRIVVNRHGGTLSVNSAPGNTRFTITLRPAHVEAC
ncbi:ATP-binding protein [Mycobacterium sp. NPDC048908]|uniref:ATP-binding protein n=1 Tax=Mycobacterium sp. NPDC048908 TaxID=3364292 RepID=UPI0037148D9F